MTFHPADLREFLAASFVPVAAYAGDPVVPIFQDDQHTINAPSGCFASVSGRNSPSSFSVIGREWQIVWKGDIKLRVSESTLVCRSPSCSDHLRDKIDANDFAFGSDNDRYAQSRLSGARSNIKDCLSAANPRILDQSLRDWRKHLPDRFAALLPERRRAAPSVDHILVALHGRKYSRGRLTRDSENTVPEPRRTSVRIADDTLRTAALT
jgi:hypothetical protein